MFGQSLPISLAAAAIVQVDILFIIALHPVNLRAESIVEGQLFIGAYVSFSHKYSPVRPSGETYFSRAIGVLLVCVVREAHHVTLINGIDRDFSVDVKGIRATYLVINLP